MRGNGAVPSENPSHVCHVRYNIAEHAIRNPVDSPDGAEEKKTKERKVEEEKRERVRKDEEEILDSISLAREHF